MVAVPVVVGVVVAVVVGVGVAVLVAVVVGVVVAVVVGVASMTQTQELRRMFDNNGGRLTLGDIMKTYLGASYRQRLSDLRRDLAGEGKTITCYPNREEGHKSETYWQIEDLPKPLIYAEPSGQLAMVFK